MLEGLRPFVTSEYCLRCRECCLFRRADSVWAPRASQDELKAVSGASGLLPESFSARGSFRTIAHEDTHRCFFLDPPGHQCRVYPCRPFECQLYPFLVSSGPDGVELLAHLSCPFVQEKMDSKEWTDQLAALRAFFSGTAVRRKIRVDRGVFPNYAGFREEVLKLFDVRWTFPETLRHERERFERHIDRSSRELSAAAFSAIFLWQDAFDFSFEEINGSLCVLATQPAGTFLYLPPLGGGVDGETVAKVFARMRSLNKGGSLTRIENVSRGDLAAFDPALYVMAERGREYVYAREDVAGLHGNALKSQRHDVNLVRRSHQLDYRRYSPSDRAACQQVFGSWNDRKRVAVDNDDMVPLAMLEESRSVHEFLWDYADALGIEGRVVLVDGELAAYTFGYRLNDETFCVAAEVADPDVKGLAAFIFHAFADDEALKAYKFLNTMDDFGLPSVRRSKMAWHPCKFEPVYTVTEKGPAC